MSSKVILALDGMSRVEACMLARAVKDEVWGFKVNDLLLREGVEIISELKAFGRVFADAKLHDIPNTVANGVKHLVAAGADLITVHSSGGGEMLRAALSVAESSQILAITLLTSLSEDDCKSIYNCSKDEFVLNRALQAAHTGVFGIVCSAQELSLLESKPELRNLHKITPGIRPSWHGKPDDQQRTMTPDQALSLGASLLVVGRPITAASDPLEAAKRINSGR